jgi:hypothetical protein
MKALRSPKVDAIRQYDAVIERFPSSPHFLLYQEDKNVSGDCEDLRDSYSTIQHLATAPTTASIVHSPYGANPRSRLPRPLHTLGLAFLDLFSSF